MKKYAPIILPITLLIGIIILGCRKIILHHDVWVRSCINFDIPLIALYIAWMIYEATVSCNDIRQHSLVLDYGTREFYGTSHALTVLSALWFTPAWQTPGACQVIGFIIFILGVGIRIWAIQTLGQYYSHVVRKIADHRIIDTGPYQVLRHPAYTGMITAHIGITIFYFNRVTPVILVLLLVPSIVVRIIIEEKTLMNIPGYPEFAQTRKRIIPFVW